MMHTIEVEEGPVYRCPDTESLLRGMEAIGKKGIPVGCRNGGCGVCKVAIVDGTYVTRVMSREHVSEEDEACGRVLACRVRPCSDMRVKVLGQMKKTSVGWLRRQMPCKPPRLFR